MEPSVTWYKWTRETDVGDYEVVVLRRQAREMRSFPDFITNDYLVIHGRSWSQLILDDKSNQFKFSLPLPLEDKREIEALEIKYQKLKAVIIEEKALQKVIKNKKEKEALEEYEAELFGK